MWYNQSWYEKGINSKPVYNQKFFKTKIKSHGDEVTDFLDEWISKVDSNHTCLAVISLDSAFNKNENYFLQAFLKECEHI